jgi:hypothetical protein
MKTILVSILYILLLSATFATAQYSSKISFGLLGGVNIQNLYGQDIKGKKLGNELIMGFHAGINIQILIVGDFYFQPGVLFSTKGTKKSHPLSTTTTHLSYIEAPLNFVYKTSLGNGYFMLGLGPYIGYAVMGKEKTEVGGVSQKKNIEFRNIVKAGDPLSVPYYKAFDLGGNIFFGYELERVFTQLNIQLGMININSVYKGLTDDKSQVKNTGFGLSFGYRF